MPLRGPPLLKGKAAAPALELTVPIPVWGFGCRPERSRREVVRPKHASPFTSSGRLASALVEVQLSGHCVDIVGGLVVGVPFRQYLFRMKENRWVAFSFEPTDSFSL